VRRALPLLLALALALPCCGQRGAPVEPPFAGLALDLTPDPARGELTVEVRLSADRAAGVTELAVARAWADTRGADAVVEPRARDDSGEIQLALKPDDGGPDRVVTLGRPPRGALFVGYRARPGTSRFAVHLAADRLSGVGHAFLMLPRLGDAVPARIRFHLGALDRGAEAASSFGFGAEVVTTATTEELAHAAYVAGKLWLETPAKDAPALEQEKRLVVLGAPPFDTRTAYDFSIAALGAVDRLFTRAPSAAPEPFSFLLVAEPGLGRADDGAYLTRSLGLWFDARRGLDPALQLVIAHELVHRFLGGAVRLVGADGRDAAWFTEGFTVHFARRIMLDGGFLRPADVLVDLRRTLGEPVPGEERAPPDYRRGALWAAYFDAAVRRASGGVRSLDDVVRALLAKARAEGRVRLPMSALREALEHDLGPAGAADLDRFEAHPDAEVALPDGAFGPCFKRLTRDATVFELGFERRSLRGNPTIVGGVVEGSAAERAGLRDGALVLSAKVPDPEAALRRGAEVELLLAQGRGGKRVRYRPVARRQTATWEVAPCKVGR
jgi:hypothetical protein